VNIVITIHILKRGTIRRVTLMETAAAHRWIVTILPVRRGS